MDYFSLLDKLIISSSTVLFGSILDQNKVMRGPPKFGPKQPVEPCARLYRLLYLLFMVKLILIGKVKNCGSRKPLYEPACDAILGR
jgi:hypothetical protein